MHGAGPGARVLDGADVQKLGRVGCQRHVDVRRLGRSPICHHVRMTVRAVIFDVGGVLEVTPPTGWLDVWRARLGLAWYEGVSRYLEPRANGLLCRVASSLQDCHLEQQLCGSPGARTRGVPLRGTLRCRGVLARRRHGEARSRVLRDRHRAPRRAAGRDGLPR